MNRLCNGSIAVGAPGSSARIAAEAADNALDTFGFAVGQTVSNIFTGRVGTVVRITKPGAYTRVKVRYMHSKQDYDIDFPAETNNEWTAHTAQRG